MESTTDARFLQMPTADWAPRVNQQPARRSHHVDTRARWEIKVTFRNRSADVLVFETRPARRFKMCQDGESAGIREPMKRLAHDPMTQEVVAPSPHAGRTRQQALVVSDRPQSTRP